MERLTTATTIATRMFGRKIQTSFQNGNYGQERTSATPSTNTGINAHTELEALFHYALNRKYATAASKVALSTMRRSTATPPPTPNPKRFSPAVVRVFRGPREGQLFICWPYLLHRAHNTSAINTKPSNRESVADKDHLSI